MSDHPEVKGRCSPNIKPDILLQENTRLERKLIEEKKKMGEVLWESLERVKSLESKTKRLQAKLLKCIQKREPKKFRVMAEIMEVAHRNGGIVPAVVTKELGIKPSIAYEYLRELTEIGMLKKLQKGYYRCRERPTGMLEEEISWRLAGRKYGG
jgi:predicted transcriptional regulator